jgi:hypothetical protein
VPALFDNPEQMNKAKKPKFQSIEDLLNQVLLDPSIMASDPLPAVYTKRNQVAWLAVPLAYCYQGQDLPNLRSRFSGVNRKGES